MCVYVCVCLCICVHVYAHVYVFVRLNLRVTDGLGWDLELREAHLLLGSIPRPCSPPGDSAPQPALLDLVSVNCRDEKGREEVRRSQVYEEVPEPSRLQVRAMSTENCNSAATPREETRPPLPDGGASGGQEP